MVWQHNAIPDLARALGVDKPPKWKGADFDSMWILTYASGKAELTLEQEGLARRKVAIFNKTVKSRHSERSEESSLLLLHCNGLFATFRITLRIKSWAYIFSSFAYSIANVFRP